MSAPLWFATALTRSWAATYTRGLPAELRNERCDEIDCDLWEHQWLASRRASPATGTAIEILARMLVGIPSDITWRAQAGSPSRADRSIKMNESWYTRVLLAAGLAIGLFAVVTGILAAFDVMDDADGSPWIVGGTLTSLAGAAVTTGLLLCRRYPLAGIGLVLAGTITIAVVWYWAQVVTIPVGLGLIAVAILRSGISIWPFNRPGPSPTGAA
ncbi:MAG: hypothetical protein WD904_08870 [Dehalococcoidia bacterium]